MRTCVCVYGCVCVCVYVCVCVFVCMPVYAVCVVCEYSVKAPEYASVYMCMWV